MFGEDLEVQQACMILLWEQLANNSFKLKSDGY